MIQHIHSKGATSCLLTRCCLLQGCATIALKAISGQYLKTKGYNSLRTQVNNTLIRTQTKPAVCKIETIRSVESWKDLSDLG